MKRAALFVVLATAGATGTARADINDEVMFGSFTRALRSPSANAITSDSLDGGGLHIARDLGIQVMPRLAVWATAGIVGANASGTMFRTMTTDLGVLQITAGARARYTLWRHLAIGARIEVGTERTDFTLTNQAVDYRDVKWGAVTEQAVSLDLFAVGFDRFAIGMRFEVGYAATTRVDLVPRAGGGDDDMLVLPGAQASFGHLDLGGPFVGLSLVSQF
jgi:hypothetical protein